MVLFVSSKSFSQEWTFVGTQKSIDSIFIRSNYVSKSYDEGRENVIKIWVKSIHESIEIGKKKYEMAELRSLWFVDCSAKQIKSGSMALYSRTGDLLQSSENSFSSYTDVIPGTMGEHILAKVCSIFDK